MPKIVVRVLLSVFIGDAMNASQANFFVVDVLGIYLELHHFLPLHLLRLPHLLRGVNAMYSLAGC